MNNREVEMFGMSIESIEKNYMNSVTGLLSGQEMVVMSILSDCQEMLIYKRDADKNLIRQQLNVAKYILSEMMDKRRAA